MELSPELVDSVATVCRENLAREFDNSTTFGPMMFGLIQGIRQYDDVLANSRPAGKYRWRECHRSRGHLRRSPGDPR